ncbi:hypothetical protein Pmani_013393 [Petrolisthes manimaculis]|uniref:Uncharacterized protein n=1 Tax=Petrolisthes manimaculis TaxID=1843537 RepID=A0AAE1PVZ1_9EUCA|nr:hypothetical protein Pmani_013393 [Petrolisthes manimaculis]
MIHTGSLESGLGLGYLQNHERGPSAFEGYEPSLTPYLERTNQEKLINGGQLKYSRPLKSYINLTEKTVTPDQEDLLNLDLNCHIISKPKKHQKKVECEVLIDNDENLARRGEVTVKPTFKQEIVVGA